MSKGGRESVGQGCAANSSTADILHALELTGELGQQGDEFPVGRNFGVGNFYPLVHVNLERLLGEEKVRFAGDEVPALKSDTPEEALERGMVWGDFKEAFSCASTEGRRFPTTRNSIRCLNRVKRFQWVCSEDLACIG